MRTCADSALAPVVLGNAIAPHSQPRRLSTARCCVESMDAMRIELSRLRLEIGRKRHLARTFNRLSEGDKSEPKLGSAPFFWGIL